MRKPSAGSRIDCWHPADSEGEAVVVYRKLINYVVQIQGDFKPEYLDDSFLVRVWLSENKDIHDIATSPSALQDPVNPVEGAIDTLSAILQLPVWNDFGITGAPWTKGVKKDAVGGSVLIGGHRKKPPQRSAAFRK